MVAKGEVDASVEAPKADRRADMDGIKHKDVGEIGTEWSCCQATEQLGMGAQLSALGWSEEQVQLALIQIVCRGAYTFSELPDEYLHTLLLK